MILLWGISALILLIFGAALAATPLPWKALPIGAAATIATFVALRFVVPGLFTGGGIFTAGVLAGIMGMAAAHVTRAPEFQPRWWSAIVGLLLSCLALALVALTFLILTSRARR